MRQNNQNNQELLKLQKRVAELEKFEKKHHEIEVQLKAANQQLKARGQFINQQKKATETSREFAESIINTVRQPLIVLNADLKIISANRFFYKTFQVSEKETIGQLFYELGNNQWDISELEELLRKTLPEKSTVEDFEVEHDFEPIGHKIMLLNARELSQKLEKERFILLSIEDVTFRRNSEKELKRLNRELEQKAEELQQILYITTHDLRSPLVNIQGFSKEMEASLKALKELLEKVNFTAAEKDLLHSIMEEEIPEAIHYITSSTTKMDNLLKGLLALSRLGREKLTFRQLDMNQLIKQVLDNYQFEINQNDVKIIAGDLPVCMGDELQINQLFSNLIGNSLKFFDDDRRGKIIISGEKVPDGCSFTVDDNGIGIPEQYQEKVFGLFEKLNPQKPGIGLGMNIVKQVVEKHNGRIALESGPGSGTKFTIFIPDSF